MKSAFYKDSFIEVVDQQILFHHYYFPLACDKYVPLSQIEGICRCPFILRGKWRIWGTGDFRTWRPLDGRRPSRDRIFFAHLRTGPRLIGFTKEESRKVADI